MKRSLIKWGNLLICTCVVCVVSVDESDLSMFRWWEGEEKQMNEKDLLMRGMQRNGKEEQISSFVCRREEGAQAEKRSVRQLCSSINNTSILFDYLTSQHISTSHLFSSRLFFLRSFISTNLLFLIPRKTRKQRVSSSSSFSFSSRAVFHRTPRREETSCPLRGSRRCQFLQRALREIPSKQDIFHRAVQAKCLISVRTCLHDPFIRDDRYPRQRSFHLPSRLHFFLDELCGLTAKSTLSSRSICTIDLTVGCLDQEASCLCLSPFFCWALISLVKFVRNVHLLFRVLSFLRIRHWICSLIEWAEDFLLGHLMFSFLLHWRCARFVSRECSIDRCWLFPRHCLRLQRKFDQIIFMDLLCEQQTFFYRVDENHFFLHCIVFFKEQYQRKKWIRSWNDRRNHLSPS